MSASVVVISFLDEYVNKSVPQNLLLTERGFEDYARDRGLHIRMDDLEYYEELGLLYPLCRLKLPVVEEYREEGVVKKGYAALYDISHTLHEWRERGLCEDPTEMEFRPWKEYKDGFYDTARVLYHPWQFLNLKTINHWLGYNISVPQILNEKRIERIREQIKKFWNSQKDWTGFLINRINRDLRFFPFLLSIEDIYLPIIRSSFKGVLGEPDIGFQQWESQRSRFDPKETLSKYNLSTKQITNWREQIAAETRFLDPLRDWYLLVRHTNYNKRQKLRGSALFAQDCYEIIEVLGLFLEELLGEPQVGPDDIFDMRHGEWKNRIYGAEVDFANRDVLRKIVYEYGLDYDYKMILFVEGDSEYHAIPIIADAMGISFSRQGIRLEKLGGYSEISPKRIEKLLQYAMKNGIIAYIIIDNHQYSQRYVEDLINRKDLPVERKRVCIWDIDFEEDNFSVDELIEATRRVASKDDMTIELTTEFVEERRAPKTGLGNILVDICEEQTYLLSKKHLGVELGNMIAEKIMSGKVETTKIEKELINVVKSIRSQDPS